MVYDVIIIGAGVMGSATAWRLAQAGARVLVCERSGPHHPYGSSHGASRLFRYAYPDPFYVRLAVDALEGWRELERATGRTVLTTTGGVDFGDRDTLHRTAGALEASGIASEWLSEAEARRRWPQVVFRGSALHQADAAILAADDAVAALRTAAYAHGCTFEFDQPVVGLAATGSGVDLSIGGGTHRTPSCVVTAGAWTSDLLGGLIELPDLVVTREFPMMFEQVAPDEPWPNVLEYVPSDTDEGTVGFYALQSPGQGVKASFHGAGPIVHPDDPALPDEMLITRIRRHVASSYPGLVPEPKSIDACLYTTTKDHGFIIDRVDQIVVGSACSGHGFKFAPEVGRLLADLAMETTGVPERFTLSRHLEASSSGANGKEWV